MSNLTTMSLRGVNPYDAKEWFLKNLPELDNATLKLLYEKLTTEKDLRYFLVYLAFKNNEAQFSYKTVIPKTTMPKKQSKPSTQPDAPKKPKYVYVFDDDSWENFKRIMQVYEARVPVDAGFREFVKNQKQLINGALLGNGWSEVYDVLQKKGIPVILYEDDGSSTMTKNGGQYYVVLNDTARGPPIALYTTAQGDLPTTFDFEIERGLMSDFIMSKKAAEIINVF